VTPTIAQRLWLEPARLAPDDRRKLLAARAAFGLFALLPTVALAAAAVGSTVAVASMVAAGFSYALAVVVLLAYDRIGMVAKSFAATGGVLVISTFVLVQPHGDLYSILHVGLVFYVAFFFSFRRAVVQLTLLFALIAAASSISAGSLGHAAEIVLLAAGALIGTAAITLVLRRRLIDALAEAERTSATLDAFFLHAPAGFGFLDQDLRHVRVNEALAEIIGLEPGAIEGRTLAEVAPIDAPLLEPLARRAIATAEPVLGIEINDSEGRCHLVSYYPIPGRDGVVGVGTAVVDVSHLKDVEKRLEELNRQLTVLATTDELTGLPNRRMLAEQLDLALARARRGGLGVALLCLDLDRFKDINDSLGHAVGDDLLIEVADRLRGGARHTDIVARYGGDEFVILLADLDVVAAHDHTATVVERLRGLLSAPFAVGPVELSAAASIGVAIYPFDSRDAKGLLAAADAQMYVGKTAVTRVA
jgi:diguanylate cyclase (GGDEF)-like protein/PAS domain S-box-containing protein